MIARLTYAKEPVETFKEPCDTQKRDQKKRDVLTLAAFSAALVSGRKHLQRQGSVMRREQEAVVDQRGFLLQGRGARPG